LFDFSFVDFYGSKSICDANRFPDHMICVCSLFVPQITEKELESHFEKFGQIQSVQILTDRHTNKPRGFGFITYDTSAAVESALNEMQGFSLNGRELRVDRPTAKVLHPMPPLLVVVTSKAKVSGVLP
jgi:RNA recognition motif-containing protein